MKILIVLLRLNGGVGRANIEIAQELRKRGHEVDILSREDDLKKYSLNKGFFLIRNKIRQLMNEKNYNIIYTQDYSCSLPLLFPYPIFWKRHFCCFCGVKTTEDMEFFQGSYKSRFSYYYHIFLHRTIGKIMGKKLIVIGDRLKEMFPKSTLIYRGVNLNKFKPLRKKRTHLGWYSSDNEIISIKDIQKISNEVNLDLLVAKNISKDNMNKFYNTCQVFINLPRTAGFNLSWLEAMAAGTPIIIGNNKGAGAIIPISKISNKINIVKEIVSIIKNSKKINYRKWLIDNDFSWENKVKELETFFKNIEK